MIQRRYEVYVMSESSIQFDPSLYVPADHAAPSYGPVKGVLWLFFLASGIASIIGNILIRTKFLPAATASNYHQIAMLGFGLHMIGPVFAAGAVALSPRVKLLKTLSVLVLVVAGAFSLFLIFTGIFTITHIR